MKYVLVMVWMFQFLQVAANTGTTYATDATNATDADTSAYTSAGTESGTGSVTNTQTGFRTEEFSNLPSTIGDYSTYKIFRTTDDLSTVGDLSTPESSSTEDFSTPESSSTEDFSTQEDYTTAESSLYAFGDWSEWGSCSASCGSDLTQNRTRQCKPGMECEGPLGEEQPCEDVLCQDALTNGMEILLTGLGKSDFDLIDHVIQDAITAGMNVYCTFNTSTAQECCQSEKNFTRTANKTFVNKEDLEIYAYGVPGQVSVRLVIVARIEVTNTLCNSPYARRKKRVASMVMPREILKNILSSPSMMSNIESSTENAAKTILNKTVNVGVGEPTLPSELLYTTTSKDPAQAPTGVAAWIIAVAVVGSVLSVVLVVVVILLVTKKPRKVGSSDHHMSHHGDHHMSHHGSQHMSHHDS